MSTTVSSQSETWVSIPTAARLAGVSRTTMWRRVRDGQIRSKRIVGVVRVLRRAAARNRANG